MTTMVEAESDYAFWERVYDAVQNEHETAIEFHHVTVVEANVFVHMIWPYFFESWEQAAGWVSAMQECTEYPTGSQFFIVGADVNA